jgi:hypothetical protein
MRSLHCQKFPGATPGFLLCGVFPYVSGKGVDPTRLELVTSAMRRRLEGFAGVRRRSKDRLHKVND